MACCTGKKKAASTPTIKPHKYVSRPMAVGSASTAKIKFGTKSR